ncbi:MAG: histidinol-phosphate transaminase [Acidimicrobiia bacterium]
MPRIRNDLSKIPVYSPGKPIDEVMRELGLDDIVKVASNESPVPPWPEVQEAIAAAASTTNRYPDMTAHILTQAIAGYQGVDPEHIWVGAGSTQLITLITLAAAEPGTTTVFADPSFVVYPIATLLAGADAIKVPLDRAHRHDLAAMAAAVREDTRVVYVCNPNNPTGTHVAGDALGELVDAIPSDVLVMVDEAYGEYVTAPDWSTAIPLALERDNVVVTRTFSKIFGLAGLRVGYAIGAPRTLAAFLATQPPFSVTTLGQTAATEALRHVDRLEQRVKENELGREWLTAELTHRGYEVPPSQANFILVLPGDDAAGIGERMLHEGVIVRPMGNAIRISVGTEGENERVMAAWDVATA